MGSAPVFAADLAIDVVTGGNPLDGAFEFGLAFTETEGLKKGYLYSVDSWKTSSTHFESTSGHYYGEQWYNPILGGHENSVAGISSGTSIEDTALTWNFAGTNPNNRIHLELTMSALGIPGGYTATPSLLLASVSCANDIVYGEIEVSQVPIGYTALLFSTGFPGLIRFW